MTDRTFTTEFPDFAPETMPAIPAGFVDTSWHNDSCPSFRDEDNKLTIFVEHADPAAREYEGTSRFGVVLVDYEQDLTDSDRAYLYEGDDWEAALAAIEAARGGDFSKPITNLEEGKAFIQMLEDTHRMFHFEDSPQVIVSAADGAPFFTPVEGMHLRKRVAELYALDWAPAGHECPIGYALQVGGHVVE